MNENRQDALFLPAAARRHDPDTSKAARDGLLTTGAAAALERRVLVALVELGGQGTNEQAAIQSGIDLQSISPRFAPLERRGLIERTDARAKSYTSNRQRIVWGLTDLGRGVADGA